VPGLQVVLRAPRRGGRLRAPPAPGAFWQATLDALSSHVAVLDERGSIIAVNAAWRRFGAREGAVGDHIASNYLDVCDASNEPSAASAASGLRAMLNGERDGFELEYPCHNISEQRWFLLRATLFAGVEPLRVVLAHEDVTARRHAQEQAALQTALLDEVDTAILATDREHTILSWNSVAEQLYGYTRLEALGRSALQLLGPIEAEGRPLDYERMWREGSWDGACSARHKSGSVLQLYARNRLINDRGSESTLVWISIETARHKQFERDLLAARDYLRAISDSMGEALYTLDSRGRLTYMNAAAEAVLQWSAEDLLGRDIHELVHVRADGSPLPVEECRISRARERGETAKSDDEFFRRRDGTVVPVSYTAASFATDEGIEGCVVLFEDISDRRSEEERLQRELDTLSWVTRVREALAEDRFVLHAQPIVDLCTGAVAQSELLLRMRLPGRDGEELVAPSVFLPAAEQHGLIGEIDRWVVDRAAELAAAGQPVELNVSGPSVSDPTLVEDIEAAIARTGADPQAMIFELTETTLVTDERAARAFVEHMHALGCRVALDDFGTGYGTFTYLKRLPIDYLKVDVEFVRDLVQNPASRNVVEAIVSLARSFGLKTVGEGVEDDATVELLRTLGVDYAQGFHLGRPVPLGCAGAPPRRTAGRAGGG